MFENFSEELKKRLARIDHNVDAMIRADTTLPLEPEQPDNYKDSRGITRITVFDHGCEYELKDGKWQFKAPF